MKLWYLIPIAMLIGSFILAKYIASDRPSLDDSFEIIQMDGCTSKDQALAQAKHFADRAILGAPDITPANAATPARYGQRIHPDIPLVLDHASIYALMRSLCLMHTQATDTAAYALGAMIDDFQKIELLKQLRDDDPLMRYSVHELRDALARKS